MPKPHHLSIHPTPFKSSLLAIPPSPFSPRLPLTPSPKSPSWLSTSKPTSSSTNCPNPSPSNPRPASPLQWLWQCHQCYRQYSLGVTRRCLDDGHFFCAGQTTVNDWRNARGRGRRNKRHRACSSEFDYQGWKVWGQWRRSGLTSDMENVSRGQRTVMRTVTVGLEKICEVDELSLLPSSNGNDNAIAQAHGPRRASLRTPELTRKKDCWNTCDYPSECRWGRQFGVQTPPPPPPLSQPSLQPSTSAVIAAQNPPLSVPTEGVLNLENVNPNTHVYTVPGNRKHGKGNGNGNGNEKPEKLDFWSALIASARRRKSVPPSSPLAAGGEGAEEVRTPPPPPRPEVAVPVPGHGHGLEYQEANKDIDGDIVMGGNIDPALLEISPAAMLAATRTISVAPVTVEIKEIGTKSTSTTKSETEMKIKEKKGRSSYSNCTSSSSWRSSEPAKPVTTATIPDQIFRSDFGLGLRKNGNGNGNGGAGIGDGVDMDIDIDTYTDMEGLSPLKRVKSRDSGYASQM